MQIGTSIYQNCWRLKKLFFFIALGIVGVAVTLDYFDILQYMFDYDDYKTDWSFVKKRINLVLSESMKHEKGTGCVPPKMNPFAPEMMRYMKDIVPEIVCRPRDWVKCHHEYCRVTEKTLSLYNNIACNYSKIVFVDDFDIKTSSESVVLYGNSSYELSDSDQVRISCSGIHKGANIMLSYAGVEMGIRRKLSKRPKKPKSKYNILIIGFDSVSHNSVRRRMGHLYTALKVEFEAIILDTYNIVGDGTIRALLPVLTGMAEQELPEVRKSKQKFAFKHTVDEYPFIFKLLRQLGTAYIEDMPWGGTWQMTMVGFKKQPVDHYLRPLSIHSEKGPKYCHFGTPMHEVMFNLTEQVMTIDKKKKFIFTFSGDLSHDDINLVKNADEKTVNLLRSFRDRGLLNDTFVVVMGDHGNRFSRTRQTLQGKQEERMPLMSFIVPKSFQEERPTAYENLKNNTKTLTTPFDIHATLLDVLDLKEHRVQTKDPGSNLLRSMSLFEPIPVSRSCSEAGVVPHWCVCLEWIKISASDVFYERVAKFLVDHINMLTDQFRQKCVRRALIAIDYVTRQKPNDKLLTFIQAEDRDGLISRFGKAATYMTNYQVKLKVSPGIAVFEATMTYNVQTDKLSLSTGDISRVNSYQNEPKCISNFRPDLNKFCYCATTDDKASA